MFIRYKSSRRRVQDRLHLRSDALEKALLQNPTFVTEALGGTRQIRRRIGWTLFSSRVVYGCPVFMTVTPSERHSGLCVRLMRYREGDPGLKPDHGTSFRPWIGSDVPSLCAPEGQVEVDLPEYESTVA